MAAASLMTTRRPLSDFHSAPGTPYRMGSGTGGFAGGDLGDYFRSWNPNDAGVTFGSGNTPAKPPLEPMPVSMAMEEFSFPGLDIPNLVMPMNLKDNTGKVVPSQANKPSPAGGNCPTATPGVEWDPQRWSQPPQQHQARADQHVRNDAHESTQLSASPTANAPEATVSRQHQQNVRSAFASAPSQKSTGNLGAQRIPQAAPFYSTTCLPRGGGGGGLSRTSPTPTGHGSPGCTGDVVVDPRQHGCARDGGRSQQVAPVNNQALRGELNGGMSVAVGAALPLGGRPGLRPMGASNGSYSLPHAVVIGNGVIPPKKSNSPTTTSPATVQRTISPVASNVSWFYKAASPTDTNSPTSSPGSSPSSSASLGSGLVRSPSGGLKRSYDGLSISAADTCSFPQEHRRASHVHAEHKRRCNIKSGFDALQQLIPAVQQHEANAKVSKAAMLQMAADLMKQMKQEREESQQEVDRLKAQIAKLSEDIGVCQSQLPDTGAPVIPLKTTKVVDMYKEFVKQRTLQDWKFWVFSLIAEPMAESFNDAVSTASVEDMCRSTTSWTEKHCSLANLRPGVLRSLRHLSTNTSILSNPENLPDEAVRAMTKLGNSSALEQQQTSSLRSPFR